jgi:DNA (cytosine-5)-methyltransferase 1
MDAQHWGVPQRRLRISLVLDLTGGRAGEILFEPESLRGHFAPGITPGQAAPVVVGGCTEDANRAFTLKIRSGCEGGGKGALVQTEKSATLSTLQDQTLFVAEPSKAYSFDSLASNSMKSSNPHSGCREVEIAKTLDTSPPDPAKNQGGIAIVEPTFCIQGNTIDRADTAGANSAGVKEDVCYTLNTIDRPAVAFALDCRNMTANEELSATLQAKGNGGQSLNYINPVAEPLIYDARGNGDGITSPTMTGDHNIRVTDYTAITLQGDTVAGALLARDYKGPGRADSLGRVIAQPVGADLYNGTLTGDKAVTLTTATGQGGANTGPSVIEKIIRWIVRRLTPTECERLQGYPDGWTDLGEWIDSRGKAHKDADTPRYKALGNSIALPQWYYVLGGISDRLPEDATLGSLFDGIGGFPYVWAQLHAGRKELCVWASEIEEFPIAVTKKWFPEVEDGKLF